MLATALHPPTRDYFHLPRIDSIESGAPQSSNTTKPSAASSYTLPSLDSYQQQASAQYWPGATSSTGAGPALTAQLNTLPTPPTDIGDSTDGYKPPGVNCDFSNPTDAPLQQPDMATSVEQHGAPTSLTQRRPAANNLPNFELPAPFNSQFQQRYGPPQRDTLQQTTNIGGGNLLTPPSTVPTDNLSPLSSILNSANAPLPHYDWPPLPNGQTGLTPLPLASGNTPQSSWPPSLSTKSTFSPPSGSLGHAASGSPTASESLPPPPYDLNSLPPLPTSGSMGAPNNLPAFAGHQQATMQAFMNQGQAQTPVSASNTQPSPGLSIDPFNQRPQSTPSFYTQSQPSSAQQSTFPPYTHSSPIQPLSAPPQGPRLSPLGGQPTAFPPPPSQYSFGRGASYAPYLPALSAPTQIAGAPVLANINTMGMMGMPGHGLYGAPLPWHSGIAGHLAQNIYGPHATQPHNNERPFRCDQCPQSFNRNHDLKRHKRIHLAVKPFPCQHCDKSFSRKDALKVDSTKHL